MLDYLKLLSLFSTKVYYNVALLEPLKVCARRMRTVVQLYSSVLLLYTDTLSCVRADGRDSDWFLIGSGVRQGCVVAPDLFLTPMDWLLNLTDHLGFMGTTIGAVSGSRVLYPNFLLDS